MLCELHHCQQNLKKLQKQDWFDNNLAVQQYGQDSSRKNWSIRSSIPAKKRFRNRKLIRNTLVASDREKT